MALHDGDGTMCDEQEVKFSGDYWNGVQDTLEIVTSVMEEASRLPAEGKIKALMEVLIRLDDRASMERREWVVERHGLENTIAKACRKE